MLVPTAGASCEMIIKKSRFIGVTIPVSSQEEARYCIDEARKNHPDSSHVVHSYILGPSGDIFSFSDDREPKNTAGRPVLEVLKGSGLTNIIVLVIRYFGGTKLGTGGLVHAYSQTAKEVLHATPSEPLVETVPFSVVLPYEHYELIRKFLLEYQVRDIAEKFETEITITGTIPLENIDPAARGISNITSGKSRLSFPSS